MDRTDPADASGAARRLYRAMTMHRDGLPLLDASARTLGARPEIDLPVGEADVIEPGIGGMSVAVDDPGLLPDHRRPTGLGGSGRDPIFEIEATDLGADLIVRLDAGGPSGHGFIEPVRRMPFQQYQEALWATRPRWRRIDR